MKKFIEEFKAFALRGNMMDMAIGVLIGGAFSGVVTALTDNLIRPIIETVTRLLQGEALYTVGDWIGFGGSFLSSLCEFFIMALVLFCLLKAMNALMALGKKKDAAPAAPATKKCPYCLSEIPAGATRCPHCTSELSEAEAPVHV